MGFIKGTAVFTRYLVQGSAPNNYIEEYPLKIARYAFRNMDESSTAERSAGWVNILDMFDNRLKGQEFFMEPYIALAFRVDEKKIPVKALKQYCREAEEQVMKSEDLGHLVKGRKREIEEAIKFSLIQRVIPSSNVYDMIWNLDEGSVLFGCVKNKICDEFIELFYNTFGLGLTALFPYTIARGLIEGEKLDPNLIDTLGAAEFF